MIELLKQRRGEGNKLPVSHPPGNGEYGWHDRELSGEGFKEWARRGFEPHLKPTRKEIEERDPEWEHDLNQWMHLLAWIEDLEKLAQMGLKL